MGALEQITQMKGQGLSDNQIITELKQQGVSPAEINDALNQAQIKNAVGTSEPSDMQPLPPSEQPDSESYAAAPQAQEMGIPAESQYAPQKQEMPPAEGQEELYETAPEPGYEQYPAGDNIGMGADTMVEVAEQVFLEKMSKTSKQIGELNEFKTLSQTKTDSISDRLKRIETTIDKLQISILDKVGSYGQGLEQIKKEMSMIENSFGKVVNHAVEKAKSHTAKKSHTVKTKK